MTSTTRLTRTGRGLRALLALGLASAATPLLSTGAGAATTTTYWEGRVVTVVDGDTVEVDIAGDGTSTPVTIRNAGIQTTEMNRSTTGVPDCHAVPALEGLKALLPVGSRVRLSAWYADSYSSATDGQGRRRPIRYVDRIDTDSAGVRRYVDVQHAQVLAGHAMWKTEPVEKARDATYNAAMQVAMAKRVNLWNSSLCGAGPSQANPLRMWINYEADGSDLENLQGEYLRLQNRGSTDVALAGWRLRLAGGAMARSSDDVSQDEFVFPAGSVVRAGGHVTIRVTKGVQDPSRGEFFLNQATLPFFPNVSDPRLGWPGKAVFLMDPATSGALVGRDMRAVAVYPCLAACARPPLEIAAVQSKGTESVDVRVRSGVTSAVDLTGVVLMKTGYVHELPPGAVLAPGEVLRVYTGTGTSSRLTRYWGRTTPILSDGGGDTVALRTAESTVLSSVVTSPGSTKVSSAARRTPAPGAAPVLRAFRGPVAR